MKKRAKKKSASSEGDTVEKKGKKVAGTVFIERRQPGQCNIPPQ